MGFTVCDMLKLDIFRRSKLLGGEEGLDNEILGTTIIEAPDIVKFINGGEVLLTGFYAFQTCTPQEFKGYIDEVVKKKVSAIVLKRGREVDHLEEMIRILMDSADEHAIPVLEVPFEISFRDILKAAMEHLFNEEVIKLKYFKTTHDNFTALSLSFHSMENGLKRILNVLDKLIGNPVALFNQNKDCLASTSEKVMRLEISEDAREYTPDFYSNYVYLRQQVNIGEDDKEVYGQYIVRLNVMYNARMYLAITEMNTKLSTMDHIAIENAVTALKLEMFRQHSIADLEKKFQNDIVNNILNGKVHSTQELQRDIKLLGIPIDGDYRIVVCNLGYNREDDGLNEKVKYTNVLNNAIAASFSRVKIQNDMDRVIVIQQVDPDQKKEEYRKELKDIVMKIQKKITAKNKELRVCAGVGKVVHGVINIPDSFKEAGDSLMFIDILGESNEDGMSKVMMFSDMGIFKLLCQLDDADMMMEYIPESLQKLYNYKKQQRQDLILTLKTYLEHNQNLTKTAQDLYVHYKTAAYRIERITQITGIDFDNPNEVLSVRIGLVVYKMIENLKK